MVRGHVGRITSPTVTAVPGAALGAVVERAGEGDVLEARIAKVGTPVSL